MPASTTYNQYRPANHTRKSTSSDITRQLQAYIYKRSILNFLITYKHSKFLNFINSLKSLHMIFILLAPTFKNNRRNEKASCLMKNKSTNNPESI